MYEHKREQNQNIKQINEIPYTQTHTKNTPRKQQITIFKNPTHTHTNQTTVPNKQTRRDQNRKRKVRPLPSSKCLLIDYLSSLPDCVTSEERIQLYCGFPTDDDIMTSMLKGILRWPDPAGSDQRQCGGGGDLIYLIYFICLCYLSYLFILSDLLILFVFLIYL